MSIAVLRLIPTKIFYMCLCCARFCLFSNLIFRGLICISPIYIRISSLASHDMIIPLFYLWLLLRANNVCLNNHWIVYSLTALSHIRVMVFNATSTIFQLYHDGVVSFIGRKNQTARRKPSTCRKWLTNFIT